MKIIEGFILRDIMGQATIIGEGAAQVDFNKLITLNATAAFLWRSVEGKEFDIDTLANLLVEEYGISSELAQKDAAHIAEKWVEVGIVK
ncbi:MAG: PqqD family protein [Bacteroidales bacterium]|nr:PqqD family protein [Bacteroidales bacterium]